jgi:hypothetical protein
MRIAIALLTATVCLAGCAGNERTARRYDRWHGPIVKDGPADRVHDARREAERQCGPGEIVRRRSTDGTEVADYRCRGART